MKASSGHFVLKDNIEYRDMAKVFPEVLTTFLEETEQVPEDEDVMKMFIYLNMTELEKNSKPEGYNRKGRMRLVFPMTRKEFYIRGSSKSGEVVRLTEKISKILTKAGIKHDVEWNALSIIEE
ncbi:MAG: hypothetical protein A4E32_02014 [Methanomassiliicoccales archaeon PtaU1.Bin124]|nr:MAG: hypothetical protein A4E32_02014 [Methanomassiliicoccales archaeon PtaU1.Bin124]